MYVILGINVCLFFFSPTLVAMRYIANTIFVIPLGIHFMWSMIAKLRCCICLHFCVNKRCEKDKIIWQNVPKL